MPGPLLLRFLPSRLPVSDGLSQRGYRAYVTEVGRDRFDVRVDYEVRYAPLTLDEVAERADTQRGSGMWFLAQGGRDNRELGREW